MASAPPQPHTTTSFRVLVLGPFALERDGVAIDASKWQRRVGTLFKLLATAPDRRRLKDEVIDVLWPDAPPEGGSANLRLVAYRLRLALGGGEPSPVLSDQLWIGLNPEYRWEVDFHRFEELARTGGDDVVALEQALALWRGEALVEDRYEDWAMPVRDRVQRTWRELCLRLAAAHQAHGSDEQAVQWFERVLASDPIDEEALRGLLKALFAAGRRVDALRRYQQFEQRLTAELGVPPSAETMAVVQELHARSAEPAPPVAPRERPLPVGVFLGALPEGPILGRDEELERLLLAVDAVEAGTGRAILLAGERGVGKTRLAQEVALRVRARGFVVATGRCNPQEQSAALHPLREALTLAWEQAPRSIQAQLASQRHPLSQLLPEPAGSSLQQPLPEIVDHRRSGSAGGPLLDRAERHDLLRTITAFLVTIAQERPLGLLLDDLQGADDTTLDLLVHLVRQGRDYRIFVLGTYCDSDLNGAHRLSQEVRALARDGLVERVSLRRLSSEGTAAMVNAAVGTMEASEEFVEFVYRRTKGNPFYVAKMLEALGGHYCLIRQIGAGGMGRVFEAVETRTGDLVAAKIMFARTEADPRALQRFQQEGAVLAALDHPNIVKVYETILDEHANSIVMELLSGRSLGQILRAPGDTQRLEFSRVKRLVTQVAAALACAHDHGIVHRDIKPDNVMVLEHDHVKVTDFGIARLVRPKGPLTTLTSTGMTLGTPLYMAPEQIEGKPVDGRADIYSLGAVLYQLVTGRPPFEGHDPLSIAFKHVHEAPTPPQSLNPDVPDDWQALILTALAKDPGDRFQSAAELEAAVAALSEEREPAPEQSAASPITMLPEPSSPPHSVERSVEAHEAIESPAPVQPHRRIIRRAPIAALGVGVVALVALLAGFLVLERGPTKHAVPPSPSIVQPTGNGPGQFRGAAGIAVNAIGNVYAVDEGNNRVQIFAPDGSFEDQFGGKGQAPVPLNSPTGIGVGPHGILYVADGAGRIQKFSATGVWLDTFPARILKDSRGRTQQEIFTDVAADLQKHLYAIDPLNDLVVKFTVDKTFVKAWGGWGSTPGHFRTPTGVAVDARGNVYVADTGNERIQIFSPDGRPLRSWGQFGSQPGRMNAPTGIAVGGAGNVFVADTGNSRIEEFTGSGRFLRVIGGPGRGPGHFVRLSSIAVDRRGFIYATDSALNRVQTFSPTGKLLWITNGIEPLRYR